MSNHKDDALKQASLHVWQARNFLIQDNSLTSTKQQKSHLSNIAQVVFALQNEDLNKSFANTLLQEELVHCFPSKSILNDEKTNCKFNDEKKTQNLKKDNFSSQVNIISQKKTMLIKELAASISSSKNLWLQEVQQNPLINLIHQKKFYKKTNSTANDKNISTNVFNKKSNLHDNNNKQLITSHCMTSQQHLSRNGDSLLNKQRDVKRKHEDLKIEDEDEPQSANCFKSAREQLAINQKKKFQRSSPQGSFNKKSLGSRPRNQCYAKFIPPSSKDSKEDDSSMLTSYNKQASNKVHEEIDPKLKGIEPQLVELVMSEIMDHGPPVAWDDIAGLEFAKATIKEIVIWPMLRPDIFTGLRGPPKGILLFGPPGTGKTLIGKCIANQSGATFFSISASSLTSKWIGQAEKMVRALFAVASLHQPAVIFIDEIDSLLSQRSDTEHESSRRIKTEFFVQLDGATTSSEDRILVVGATNRPQEIDEAARRRLVKRLYIPLPDDGAREQIISKLLKQQSCLLTQDDILDVVAKTSGYSGADVTNLCKDAALGPIRSLQGMDISKIDKDEVRPIEMEDFQKSLQRVRASVSQKDLIQYEEWNKIYGCGSL